MLEGSCEFEMWLWLGTVRERIFSSTARAVATATVHFYRSAHRLSFPIESQTPLTVTPIFCQNAVPLFGVNATQELKALNSKS